MADRATAPASEYQRNARLNWIAGGLLELWGRHIPLSVRYKAAELADDVVAAWIAEEQDE